MSDIKTKVIIVANSPKDGELVFSTQKNRYPSHMAKKLHNLINGLGYNVGDVSLKHLTDQGVMLINSYHKTHEEVAAILKKNFSLKVPVVLIDCYGEFNKYVYGSGIEVKYFKTVGFDLVKKGDDFIEVPKNPNFLKEVDIHLVKSGLEPITWGKKGSNIYDLFKQDNKFFRVKGVDYADQY